MQRETLTGSSLPMLYAEARAKVGPDAVLLSVRRVKTPNGYSLELVAADPEMAAALEASRSAASPSVPRPKPNVGRTEILAVVGPTGAGKTTTVAKLANHASAFGHRRVGLVTLDTYRVGAIEQLGLYAKLSKLPMEVVYESGDVFRVLGKLRGCDVILVDTPGRGPREREDFEAFLEILRLLQPGQVHLTLPAYLTARQVKRAIAEYSSCGVTHLLPTKVDEGVDGEAMLDLQAWKSLPLRWIADGQRVPQDLQAWQGAGAAKPEQPVEALTVGS